MNQGQPTYDDIIRWFSDNGWIEKPVSMMDKHSRNWFKRFPGEPKCKSNALKAITIRAMLWDHRAYDPNALGLELQIQADPAGDDGWVIFTAYGFADPKMVPNQAERLLKAWRAVAG